MDPRTQAMADVLVKYSVAVRPGDWVVIQSSALAEPMIQALVHAVLAAGGNPTTLFNSQAIQEIIFSEGTDEQLSFVSPLSRTIYNQADVLISLMAPANTRTLAGVLPGRMAVQARATEPLLGTMMRRAADKELRWTGAAYPTNAGAQDAGMSLRSYQDFVYGAALLDQPDPVAAWKQLGERQQAIVDFLQPRKMIHIVGPGTDLTLSVEGRTWINDCGHENFPGGEVFTGPVEDSAEGVIEFTYPAYLQGREVTNIRLRFEGGVVVEASAAGDESFLHQMLDLDDGARRLGEFAFGTNPGIQNFSKNTLFDEKMAGTLHMALGRSYPDTGGTNISALHWDMVYNLRNGAVVTVDDQVLSKNGEFCI